MLVLILKLTKMLHSPTQSNENLKLQHLDPQPSALSFKICGCQGRCSWMQFFDHTCTFDITSFQTWIFRLRLALKEESSNFFHVTVINEATLSSEKKNSVFPWFGARFRNASRVSLKS